MDRLTHQMANWLRRSAVTLATFSLVFSAMALAAVPVAANETITTGGGDGNETCPAPTTLLVTFNWTGTGYSPNGGNAHGVNVTGDADMAFWTSSQVISALVISAGGASYNIALDFPETVGSVSPHHYAVFGGASIDSLGFCVGEKTRPDTTTSGPSVELSKTAECATIGQDGMATVTGTITAELDSRRSARITTALDTILGPGDVALSMTSIGDLIGQVVTPDDDEVTVAYEITFDPGDVTSFDNFIEVTIEQADTGEDRMKIYNARAAFELCDQPPGEEQGELTIVKWACAAEAVDVAFFVNDPNAPVDGCDAADGEFTLNPGAISLNVDETDSITLDAGAYTLTETAPNAGTSDSFNVVAGEETVVVVINYFVEGEQGGNPPPKGGDLPDTALALPSGTAAALVALAMLSGLGAAALATVETRRRR